MKLSACLALCFALGALTDFAHADDRVRGVNYDPVHSFEFARAVGMNDLDGMKNAVKADLDKIKELHSQGYDIRSLKTFFTDYTSLGSNGPMVSLNIADVVDEWNKQNPNDAITLALGVYEFRVGSDSCTTTRDCVAWTQVQVQEVIKAVKAHPGLVRRIVVGNEDISKESSPGSGTRIPDTTMIQRVTDDIVAVKAGRDQI
jgi:hypothetical protein